MHSFLYFEFEVLLIFYKYTFFSQKAFASNMIVVQIVMSFILSQLQTILLVSGQKCKFAHILNTFAINKIKIKTDFLVLHKKKLFRLFHQK